MAQESSVRGAQKGPRLGTRMRGALAEAYQARGHRKSNLVFAYSAKSGADVMLDGRLRYGHFLLCEATPEIETIEYGCGNLGQQKSKAASFDAVATLVTGMVEYHQVRSDTALQDAPITAAATPSSTAVGEARMVLMTEREIYANPTLIRNWHRVLPWLAQLRDVALNNHVREIAALLRDAGSVRLADVLALGEASSSAVYAGAAFKGVQAGLFVSDLDVMPVSVNTRISLGTRS